MYPPSPLLPPFTPPPLIVPPPLLSRHSYPPTLPLVPSFYTLIPFSSILLCEQGNPVINNNSQLGRVTVLSVLPNLQLLDGVSVAGRHGPGKSKDDTHPSSTHPSSTRVIDKKTTQSKPLARPSQGGNKATSSTAKTSSNGGNGGGGNSSGGGGRSRARSTRRSAESLANERRRQEEADDHRSEKHLVRIRKEDILRARKMRELDQLASQTTGIRMSESGAKHLVTRLTSTR